MSHTHRPPGSQTGAERRVHMVRQSIIDENGSNKSATIYSSTKSLAAAAWIVTAWHDPMLDHEFIKVVFRTSFAGKSNVEFEVYWGETPNTDFLSFRQSAVYLWLDEKRNNRVTLRYKDSAKNGCFLIRVRNGGETIDFYHKSQRRERQSTVESSGTFTSEQASEPPAAAFVSDVPAVPDSDLVPEFGLYWLDLAELRRLREKLEATDLHADDKAELKKLLDQRAREMSAEYLGKVRQKDHFTPDR